MNRQNETEKKKIGQFGWNKRKLRTLEIFQEAFPEALRPEAYARRIGKFPARAAYSYLKRLERWGLLVSLGKPIRYRITDKGRRRLAWLRSV